MPQILWSRTLHIWPFPLLKHTHTLGQRKSSTTINQAAAAARERESEREKKTTAIFTDTASEMMSLKKDVTKKPLSMPGLQLQSLCTTYSTAGGPRVLIGLCSREYNQDETSHLLHMKKKKKKKKTEQVKGFTQRW